MRRWSVALVALVALSYAAPSHAGSPGLRLGLTDDPETIFAGFFYEAPISRTGSSLFVLEPGVDLGFGDDADFFTLRGNLNAEFLFGIGEGVALYPLLGLSLYYVNVDCGFGEECDDLGFGVNVGGGITFDRFNIDVALGINDIPDITLAFGFVF